MKKLWNVIDQEHSKKVHVVPLEDLIEHKTSGSDCPCIPDVEEQGKLIIHNSLDGRELDEKQGTGKKAKRPN